MLNSNAEIWKDMIGFEGRYQVSNLGRVRSILSNHGRYQEKIKVQRPRSESCPYRYVQLSVKDQPHHEAVHRAVAKAFIPNPDNKPMVNHIDGNKLNNNACNLEWNTYSENIKHAHSTGLKKASRNSLAVKQGSSSKYIYVSYDKSRDRFNCAVKILGTRKSIQKNFSCKKYGSEEAEKMAAEYANIILDSLGDTERPRNITI